MQSGKYRCPGNRHQIARQKNVIHHFREHISTALEFSGNSWRLSCFSQLLPLCYNTTNSWPWNI
ncbi:unnamed protein product [Staurois parvus]|uniref:Uncharacterized protein n=1 Tax=Staurois parvus TaxID=386267 RepID=A0ABN9CJL6_9NEOB|nr:unnamed protein product [Staurois parvus]